MNTTELLHSLIDKRMVRHFCNLMFVPSIWESLVQDESGKLVGNMDAGFKVSQKYIDARIKAEEEYQKIISNPERTKEVVSTYIDFLNERKIDELESELEELKTARREARGRRGRTSPNRPSMPLPNRKQV